MSNTNTGGAAFPNPHFRNANGMRLRDYFAAKAMQSYLADPAFSNVPQGEIARLAYDMADSMLKAREA